MKIDTLLVPFLTAIFLDIAERTARAILFLFIIFIFIDRVEGKEFIVKDIPLSFDIGVILFIVFTWIVATCCLSLIFIYGSKRHDNQLKSFCERHLGKRLSFRGCTYVSSSFFQFTGVVCLAIFLKEYFLASTIIFLTITYFFMFFYSPKVLSFFYGLAVGQTQLSFMMVSISLLILGDIFSVSPLTLNTVLVVYALRFSLLYFVRCIMVSAMAMRTITRSNR